MENSTFNWRQWSNTDSDERQSLLGNTNSDSNRNKNDIELKMVNKSDSNCLMIPSKSCGFTKGGERHSQSNQLYLNDNLGSSRRYSDSLYQSHSPLNLSTSELDKTDHMDTPISNESMSLIRRTPKHHHSQLNFGSSGNQAHLNYHNHQHYIPNCHRRRSGMGIDEISLDYMRANGAIPGFRNIVNQKSSNNNIQTTQGLFQKSTNHKPHDNNNHNGNYSSSKKSSVVSLVNNLQYNFQNFYSNAIPLNSMNTAGCQRKIGRHLNNINNNDMSQVSINQSTPSVINKSKSCNYLSSNLIGRYQNSCGIVMKRPNEPRSRICNVSHPSAATTSTNDNKELRNSISYQNQNPPPYQEQIRHSVSSLSQVCHSHSSYHDLVSSSYSTAVNRQQSMQSQRPQKVSSTQPTQSSSIQQPVHKGIGYRLGRRRELCEKRMRISDFSLSFAIFGIIVMVIDSEMLWAGVYKKNSLYSIFLKSLISISTGILLALILAYHALVVQLFSYEDCIADWKIAITWKGVAQLLLELSVCVIHPFPGLHTVQISMIHQPPSNIYDSINRLEYMTEPFFSIPMFFRLYLIFRSLLLHSKMFRDAGSRSIAGMNKVNFNTRFILKTMMTTCPGTMLLTFILSLWILLSWTLRICELTSAAPTHGSMINCMWLISVTFLSIGYGDIVPHTNYGRAISICAGLMGSACTALLVAVFARKLELTKAEKHVTQFMMENQLTKKLKFYAANVLRETWLIYKYTKLTKDVNASRVRTHQRKFLTAIHGLRKLKVDQRKFKDNSNTLVDLAKTQSNIYETVTDMRLEHNCLDSRINKIETNLLTLQDQLSNLPDILSQIIKSSKLSLQPSQILTDTNIADTDVDGGDADTDIVNDKHLPSSSSCFMRPTYHPSTKPPPASSLSLNTPVPPPKY